MWGSVIYIICRVLAGIPRPALRMIIRGVLGALVATIVVIPTMAIMPYYVSAYAKIPESELGTDWALVGHENIEMGMGLVQISFSFYFDQKSEEEGKLVKDFYNRLFGSIFLDNKNPKKVMNEEDILVVAPYNVQVNYLKSILPKGARVGTIDKFQGQQAPATIISMTTSDPESLPRNVNFFFSRNRLNVAISRSQCLSIVIMNKKILEIACKKVEHIHLVNTFMKLLEFEKK